MKFFQPARFLFLAGIMICVVSIANARAQDGTNQKDLNRVFIKVEIEASYPGGDTAWTNFLNHNLHYPVEALGDEIQGVVVVGFIVDSAGNISHIQALSGPVKGGLREEAVRVVTASGHWLPALQNGYKVNSYRKLPISFRLKM